MHKQPQLFPGRQCCRPNPLLLRSPRWIVRHFLHPEWVPVPATG
jgi:hypothetical protein